MFFYCFMLALSHQQSNTLMMCLKSETCPLSPLQLKLKKIVYNSKKLGLGFIYMCSLIPSLIKEKSAIFFPLFSLYLTMYWLCVLPVWCRSVLCGGSTAIFMFGYCIYFYARSNMNSFIQLSFFIGYNACMCYAFFLILGTISFHASLMFVRHIYHAVKSEWICSWIPAILWI